jgi:sarcosine oxidase
MAVQQVDLVVIGGGAMGLATAWAATTRTRPATNVVMFERFEPGHARGASHGGERIWRHAYANPAYVEMALAAGDRWRRLERDSGRPLLHLVGCVEHGADAELEPLARTADAFGVRTERLSPSDASRRWPALRFATDVLVQPDAGWVRAADGLEVLRAAAAAAGADLRFGVPVTRVELQGQGRGVRVVTGDDVLVAPVAVVAAGAWTTNLLAAVGAPALPPLTTTEEHVFFFEPGATAGGGGVPSFIHWEGTTWYGLPAVDGRTKVGEHHTGTVTTGDERAGAADPARIDRIERYAREWLPGLLPTVVATTTCLYTSTPTYDFVLDRIGPVVIGAGFSGHGFKFVPEIGHRLAAMALDDAPAQPPFTLASHAAAAGT